MTTIHRLKPFKLTTFVIKLKPYKYIIAIQFNGGKYISFNVMPTWSVNLYHRVRKLFPYFYAVGLQDCDSGGRVTAWYPVLAYNYWHLNTKVKQWNGAGDGEIWQSMNVVKYIKWLYQLKKERKLINEYN